MPDYPSNSNRSKKEVVASTEEPKKERFEKVVSGTTSKRKQSGAKKLRDIFIPEDVGNVGDYLLFDVFVPTAKRMVAEGLNGAIDMLLYGGSGKAPRRSYDSRGGYSGRVSYRSYYDEPRREERPERRRLGVEYEEIIFDNRGDAELVLEAMEDAAARYGVVSIFDMYDFAGELAPYTYSKYGWTSVKDARVTSVRGGYVIDMPRPLPID